MNNHLIQELQSFGVELDLKQQARYREWTAQNPFGGARELQDEAHSKRMTQQRGLRARRRKTA
jgi:hypothetical protein